ncbi:hypothetical protein MHO82_22200 [Vibrio sp. Of7-15]|uniref:hypothetical protein n=1 Tax=Vibrio sp. Of7-15 TaxID=2724879 RepID=UPI001EF3C72B|nr:hypothetical protein [Vibrio sp. Of7-15]MCG7499581.1 hypothetical protein [Vibrio sp. Of7-15]
MYRMKYLLCLTAVSSAFLLSGCLSEEKGSGGTSYTPYSDADYHPQNLVELDSAMLNLNSKLALSTKPNESDKLALEVENTARKSAFVIDNFSGYFPSIYPQYGFLFDSISDLADLVHANFGTKATQFSLPNGQVVVVKVDNFKSSYEYKITITSDSLDINQIDTTNIIESAQTRKPYHLSTLAAKVTFVQTETIEKTEVNVDVNGLNYGFRKSLIGTYEYSYKDSGYFANVLYNVNQASVDISTPSGKKVGSYSSVTNKISNFVTK